MLLLSRLMRTPRLLFISLPTQNTAPFSRHSQSMRYRLSARR
jgi:hypothetical protein